MDMNNSITVHVWLVETNRVVRLRPLSVTSARDATIHQLVQQVADERKINILNLQLWKPREFLWILNDLAGRALVANLEKSKWNLRWFCDEVSPRGFDTLHELFGRQDDPAAKQTALVAWIRPPTWAAQPSSSLRSGTAAHGQTLTRTDRLSPSDRAEPSCYLECQNGEGPIFDGRYGGMGGQTLAAPVEIYHPVFASFLANVENESLDVPEDVVRSTAAFMVSVSRITTNDGPHTHQVVSDLGNLISAAIVFAPNSAEGYTISHSRASAPSVQAALAIVEGKKR